jgi:hypothetical protein
VAAEAIAPQTSAPPLQAVAPAPDEASALDPATLLLFSVQLDQLTLTDGMIGYGAPEDPLLPVGELTRLLEMDVEVLPTERRIIGRIGEARRSLVVDLATGTAKSGGRDIPLRRDEVEASDTDIFVKASALQRLMPFKLSVEAESLSLKVEPEELLPVQTRMQRVMRRQLGGSDVERQDEVLRVETPYRLFSMPALDAAVGLGLENSDTRTPFRYDVRIGADLLYTGFQGYFGSDERGQPSTARLLFERRSVEGRLLGPLKARTISVGDVYTPGLALGPRSTGGRGVLISTVPLDQTNIFNRIDLRGELPLGYDVELYVNDILRSGQNTPAKGRYEFLNVPLTQGINIIRVVTYGPRGERSENTRIINVGGGVLRRGEATFELGLVQQDDALLQFRSPPEDEVVPPGRGGFRGVATLNYGLTSTLTLTAAAALIPTENDARQLYTLGLRTSFFGLSTQLDGAYDSAGGSAVALGLAGNVFGVSTVLRHAEFQGGFVDENGPSADVLRSMRRRSEATFDGNLQIARQVVPISLRGLRNEYSNGSIDLSASARASTTAASFLLSSGLEYQRSTTRTFTNQQLNGYLAASTFRGYKWQIRSTLDFEVLPELRARALAVTADRDISENLALRFGVGQALNDAESFNVTGAAIFKLRFADLALNADYNNAEGAWRLGAQLNFGLSYNPLVRRYQVTRPGPGSGGSLLFEAFLDRNGNGIFDGDDQPVPNVTLEGAETKIRTGPDGKAFVTGLGSSPTGRLLVGLEEVENTSVQTPPTTVQFSPRAGSFTTVRYPMKPTGEVLVSVNLRRPDGVLVGLSAAQIRLVGDNGYTAEASTEFDGSASFQNLPVGKYRLELDSEQAKRLRMSLLEAQTVTIAGDGAFAPDVVAEVRFAPREEEPADAQPSAASAASVQQKPEESR